MPPAASASRNPSLPPLNTNWSSPNNPGMYRWTWMNPTMTFRGCIKKNATVHRVWFFYRNQRLPWSKPSCESSVSLVSTKTAAESNLAARAAIKILQEVRKAVAVPYKLACMRGALLPCCACHLRWETSGNFCFGKQKKAFATQKSPWTRRRLGKPIETAFAVWQSIGWKCQFYGWRRCARPS